MENGECDEVFATPDSLINNNVKSTWYTKPVIRQCMVCIGIWYIYLMHGLYIGTTTVLVAQIRREANSTDAVSDEMSSWLSSMQVFGAIPIGLIFPLLTNRVGLKNTHLITCCIMFIGYLIFYFGTNLYHVLISQAILGVSLAGMATFLPIAIAEYTTPKFRGIFLTFNIASTFWGIWISNTIATFFYWKNIALVSFVCSVYSLTTFIWPESPTWLAMKGRYTESARSHRWLKGVNENSEKELTELINYHKKSRNVLLPNDNHIGNTSSFMPTWSIVMSSQFYKPVVISLLLFLQCLVSGKVAISVYALEVLQSLTQNELVAYKAMLILDGVTVFSMYIGCILSRYIKRRTMMFLFSSVSIFVLFIMSIYGYLISLSVVQENHILIILLLSGFSIGTGCGPFILGSSIYGEIIPSRYQTLSMILNSFCGSTMLAVYIKNVPYMFQIMELHGCFLFFAILSTFILGILYVYLPETKDKTVVEIEAYFKQNQKIEKQNVTLLRKDESK